MVTRVADDVVDGHAVLGAQDHVVAQPLPEGFAQRVHHVSRSGSRGQTGEPVGPVQTLPPQVAVTGLRPEHVPPVRRQPVPRDRARELHDVVATVARLVHEELWLVGRATQDEAAGHGVVLTGVRRAPGVVRLRDEVLHLALRLEALQQLVELVHHDEAGAVAAGDEILVAGVVRDSREVVVHVHRGGHDLEPGRLARALLAQQDEHGVDLRPRLVGARHAGQEPVE